MFLHPLEKASEIAKAIHFLMNCANVVVNRPAVEAGQSILDAGGDLADGVIVYEETAWAPKNFVSFDRQAVSILLSLNLGCISREGPTGKCRRTSL